MPIIEERFQQRFKKQVAVRVNGKSQQDIALKYGLIASTPIDRYHKGLFHNTIEVYWKRKKCYSTTDNVIN